jgi:hypothetical protein
MKAETSAVDIDRNKGDFSYKVDYKNDAGVGLNEGVVNYISDVKEDPDWVREFRLRSYKTFLEKPMPTHWASKDLEAIQFDKIRYYLSGGVQPKRNWEDVPEDVKRTFERLGIPEQEQGLDPAAAFDRDAEGRVGRKGDFLGPSPFDPNGETRGLDDDVVQGHRRGHADFRLPGKVEGSEVVVPLKKLALRGVDVHRLAVHLHSVVAGDRLARWRRIGRDTGEYGQANGGCRGANQPDDHLVDNDIELHVNSFRGHL